MVATWKKEEVMNTLDMKKDVWRSAMLDSHSIATVVRLRKSCGPNMKVTFAGNIPLVVPKTRMDRILEKVWPR
jgi:hypothetical protein